VVRRDDDLVGLPREGYDLCIHASTRGCSIGGAPYMRRLETQHPKVPEAPSGSATRPRAAELWRSGRPEGQAAMPRPSNSSASNLVAASTCSTVSSRS
jgi:hypothetical protein